MFLKNILEQASYYCYSKRKDNKLSINHRKNKSNTIIPLPNFLAQKIL